MTHVVAVEDDPSIREMLGFYLADNDIRVTLLECGTDVSEVIGREPTDLLILDLKLPRENGLDIARRVRRSSNIPILVLTAVAEETHRVMALEQCVDDYMTKPFSPRELLARVRVLLRRARWRALSAPGTRPVRAYRFAGLELNVRLRELKSAAGDSAPLSDTEFALLSALLSSPESVLSRDEILERVGKADDPVRDRAIDVQVSRLRRKIGTLDAASDLIRAYRGAGYLLNTSVELVR